MAVVGMGGYFFRASDPAALKAWYREHLGVGGGCGVDPQSGRSNDYLWYHEGGPMVFEPFAADSDYFATDKQAMINLRVRDLDDLLGALRAADIAVSHEQAMDGVGRFARVHDPEGNAIELWEPPSAAG
ncbi:MAG TPA: VOC family protein [Croceibacterium sp.]|nr:VOC family protein [Croceibacterium sp.]